jgi:Zn-dependent protease
MIKKALLFLLRLDVLVTVPMTVATYPGLLWCLALVTILHEAGHGLAAKALGLMPKLHISWRGVRLAAGPRNAREGLMIAVAGPGASLLTGAAFLEAHWFMLGVCSVCAGLCMLVPAKPLDGFLAWRFARYGYVIDRRQAPRLATA